MSLLWARCESGDAAVPSCAQRAHSNVTASRSTVVSGITTAAGEVR